MKKSGNTPLPTPPEFRYWIKALPARNSADRGIAAKVMPALVKATSKSSMLWKRMDVSAKMTSLMINGPCRAASSSWTSDHSHQSGVLVKISSRTFESTSVTGLFAARECHDLVGGETGTCNTYQLRKPAGLPRPVSPFDHDTAVGGPAEFDLASRNDPEVIANRLRDRHLAFAGDLRCHREPLNVIPDLNMVIPRNLSSGADG